MATVFRTFGASSLRNYGLAAALLLQGMCAAQSARANDAENLVGEAQALSQAGLHEQALDRLQQAAAALPANRRLFAWRREYSRRVCEEVWVGGGHAYLRFKLHRVDGIQLRQDSELPVIDDTPNERYDFNSFLICIDLENGRQLWNRQISGEMTCDVHPRTGDVYLWRKHAFKLASATGEVDTEIEIPAGMGRLRAIADQQALMAPPGSSDLDRAEDWHEGENLAREKTVLRFHTGYSQKLRCESFPERRLLWQIQGVPLLHHVWHKGDLLVAQGEHKQPGTMMRVDPTSKDERWWTVVPRGIYNTRHTLRGGRSNRSNWPALTIVGDRLIAIDGDGKLLFLSLDSGKILAQAMPSNVHMVNPVVIGENLVAMSQTKAVAVPLDMILDRKSLSERELLLWQGQLYEQLGDLEQAEKAYRKLTDSDPLYSDGWIARGLLYSRG
jgi:tetratricopeptide (TPR) repeat protein